MIVLSFGAICNVYYIIHPTKQCVEVATMSVSVCLTEVHWRIIANSESSRAMLASARSLVYLWIM